MMCGRVSFERTAISDHPAVRGRQPQGLHNETAAPEGGAGAGSVMGVPTVSRRRCASGENEFRSIYWPAAGVGLASGTWPWIIDSSIWRPDRKSTRLNSSHAN